MTQGRRKDMYDDWGRIDPWDTEETSLEEKVKGLEVTVNMLVDAMKAMRIDFEKKLAECKKN